MHACGKWCKIIVVVPDLDLDLADLTLGDRFGERRQVHRDLVKDCMHQTRGGGGGGGERCEGARGMRVRQGMSDGGACAVWACETWHVRSCARACVGGEGGA